MLEAYSTSGQVPRQASIPVPITSMWSDRNGDRANEPNLPRPKG